MNVANIFLVSATVLSLLVSVADGIKCFQCNSFKNPECADVQSNDTTSDLLQDCPSHDDYQIFCRKTVQSVLGLESDLRRITRSCGWVLHKKNTTNCVNADTDFIKKRSCQCFSDACNSAPQLKLKVPTIVFLHLFIVSILMK